MDYYPVDLFNINRNSRNEIVNNCAEITYMSRAVIYYIILLYYWFYWPFPALWGGGPRVVVSNAAFHARVRGSVPGLGGLKETKMFLPHPRVKVGIVGSLRDRKVACSASDRQGSI